MDPLSITGAIIGLVQSTAAVSGLLRTVILKCKDAPREIQSLLTEVSELEIALASLSQFMKRVAQLAKDRTSLISLRQLGGTLTEAVLTISEVEALIKPLKFSNFSRNMSMLEKVQILCNSSVLATIIQRIQRNKNSLNLMFNVIQCENDAEAADSLDALSALIESMFASNEELCQRFDAFEAKLALQSSAASVDTTRREDDAETIMPKENSSEDRDIITQVESSFRFAFEDDLEKSRVYKRSHSGECDMSIRSSIARSHAWSSFSDLSLAHISIISVFAIPIFPSELASSPWYRSKDIQAVEIGHQHESGYSRIAGALEIVKDTKNDESAHSVIDPPSEGISDSLSDSHLEDYPCKGCGEMLEEGRAFELAGYRWHVDCFRCNTCDTLLDSDANLLLLDDGSLICNDCTYSCSACGNSIEDLAVLAGDQAFCKDCFRCRNCTKRIEDLKYARTSQGMFCMDCHDALMARRRRKKSQRERHVTTGQSLSQSLLPPVPPVPLRGRLSGSNLGKS